MAKGGGFRNAASWCRSIFIFFPLYIAYTVALGTLSLLSSFFDRTGRVQHWFAHTWSRMSLRTFMSPVTVFGADKIDAGKPYVYAANHLSGLDIPVLYGSLPTQFRIIAKEELFHYPFLGWHLRRSGQLAIDQTNPGSAVRSLRKAVDTLRNGMPLVIFPEGGRSANGQLQPFMTGAFYMAIKAQVEVVPLAIVGTYEALPMNSFHVRPGPIQLVVGEPISTAGMNLHDMEVLSNRVRNAIAEMYGAHSQGLDECKALASSAD
ncbi:MAG: lysophospholipid acyltransferase family protein [Terriglobales bacterium]